MAAVSTVASSGVADIDGLLSGYRWSSGSLTYSFATSSADYAYSISGFQAFNDAQKTATKLALANYAAVANLSFSLTAAADGTLRFGESGAAGTAYAYYPHTSDVGGDAFFNTVDYNSAPKGSYAYLTFLHEIGHALGLDHGQDGSAKLPTDHDSLEYSVMTYRSYVGASLTGYTVAQGSYPTTLMLADIAALQYMYGADYSTNSGNSTYKWSPSSGVFTINGTSQGGSTSNKLFMTIWDGGGTDTYDFSSYSSGLKINLNPGSWSTTSSAQLANLGDGHVARGNIANAWLHENNSAALIENVIGGSGNDSIVGNRAKNLLKGGAGNDTLDGSSGADTLYGGAGSDKLKGGSSGDRFVFNTTISTTGVDTVVDFTRGSDRIVFDDKYFGALGSAVTSSEVYAKAGATKSHDSSDNLIYNTTTGKLYYDKDGTGASAAVHIATLSNAPAALDYTDFAIV